MSAHFGFQEMKWQSGETQCILKLHWESFTPISRQKILDSSSSFFQNIGIDSVNIDLFRCQDSTLTEESHGFVIFGIGMTFCDIPVALLLEWETRFLAPEVTLERIAGLEFYYWRSGENNRQVIGNCGHALRVFGLSSGHTTKPLQKLFDGLNLCIDRSGTSQSHIGFGPSHLQRR